MYQRITYIKRNFYFDGDYYERGWYYHWVINSRREMPSFIHGPFESKKETRKSMNKFWRHELYCSLLFNS